MHTARTAVVNVNDNDKDADTLRVNGETITAPFLSSVVPVSVPVSLRG